jgi:hypothetical protein
MLKTIKFAIVGALSVLSLGAFSGCNVTTGPTCGWFVPVPVSPYFQKEAEDRYVEFKRYKRMPVLPPIPPGTQIAAMDPPCQDEVMRALEKARPVQGGLPLLHEVQRNNIRITVDLLKDETDPPRVMPLVGPVQLHHSHWKCTIYFTQVTRVGWPLPYTNTDEEAQEVVYVDHDHLHMVGNVDGGPGSYYQAPNQMQAPAK